MDRVARYFVLICLAALLAGCGTNAPSSGSGVVQGSSSATNVPAATSASAATNAPTEQPRPTEKPKPTEAPTAEPTEEPTATPKADLKLMDVGFGQNKKEIGFGFVIENPNAALAFQQSQYQVSVYDKEGTVIGTDSGYIEIVFPQERLGIGGAVYLNSDATADKIDVQILAGKASDFKDTTGFTTDKVKFIPDQYFSKVTGVVRSSYQKDVKNVRTSAILYDEAGKIIGGGFTFVDFVPAAGQTAVEVSVVVSGKPAKTELYPAFSGLSMLGNP